MELSERGFAHWEPVETTYGSQVRVYESSAAAGPRLWINIDGECHLDENPKPFAGISHGIAKGSASAHLNLEQAKLLRHRLDEAINYVSNQWDD